MRYLRANLYCTLQLLYGAAVMKWLSLSAKQVSSKSPAQTAVTSSNTNAVSSFFITYTFQPTWRHSPLGRYYPFVRCARLTAVSRGATGRRSIRATWQNFFGRQHPLKFTLFCTWAGTTASERLTTPPRVSLSRGSIFDLQGVQTVGYLLALHQRIAPVNEHPKQSNL